MMIPPPQPPEEATDIFSISDQVLADRLQFIEEIGFGNWGSVWLCRPKLDSASRSSEGPNAPQDTKIAVKLVHRSKTSTTAARVRSLWNEMKVVRSLKHEPHPSIIPFYSFIITPSYALITMAYHPRLITVEVAERHAKEWFRSLLSGVEFLHKRGVVHNDIKPANILLSSDSTPVLVDFGFAERYDMKSSKAFHSNLSYGTPEYLSPERARGLPHDTRKSDVWSLGITFFEILVGRTPFEHAEGEEFSSKEDLEKYWSRTLRGKWVGTWRMSKSIEKLLRKMILPNADLRCTASDAMADSYWTQKEIPTSSHQKIGQRFALPVTTLSTDKEVSRLLEVIPSWSSRNKEDAKASKTKTLSATKENAASPPVLSNRDENTPSSSTQSRHARSQSQPKLQPLEGQAGRDAGQEAPWHAVATGYVVAHQTLSSWLRRCILVFCWCEGECPQPSNAKNPRTTRKPLGPRSPTPPGSPVIKRPDALASKENARTQMINKDKGVRKSQVFRDLTASKRNDENVMSSGKAAQKPKEYAKDTVRNRVREWEREKERLREMERLKERMREADEQREREREKEQERERIRAVEEERERRQEQEKQRTKLLQVERETALPRITISRGPSKSPPESALPSPLSPVFEETSEPSVSTIEERSRSPNESGINLLKQSLKISIGMMLHHSHFAVIEPRFRSEDKTVQLYKSSTQALRLSTPALTLESQVIDEDESRMSLSERESWEDDALVRRAKSSLPVVRHAVRNEEMSAANQLDRMTIWIRNVEKVVEDARQNFAASTSSAPLPPLPVAPISRRSSMSRTNRSARLPRKILAANHIFVDEYESGQFDRSSLFADQTADSHPGRDSFVNTANFAEHSLQTIPSEAQSPAVPQTPSRQRRATVVTRSPDHDRKVVSLDTDTTSPSKRREKSKSQNDLARPITPITRLEFELERLSRPTPTPRLSAMVDRNLFVKPASPPATPDSNVVIEPPRNELTESPLHVDPYPPRPKGSKPAVVLDTPGRKHVEGVYDRFLMSTTGVKRLGRGYQSDNAGPVLNVPQQYPAAPKRNQKFFHSARRPMPPPVSSDDLRRASSVDEFGVVVCTQDNVTSEHQDQSSNTIAIVRKAFKAIVTGKTVNGSARLSRAL
ncbi:Serine/threonine-protein kinase par-1 [Grifola frondosa]|uniref:Serine/threonine-protein kinase par-1 n=1 Tax=Grifola frondosa TaxID=5627 RepID=A0A1C7LXA8_GRIFR|nr:Serine/threonine-protein kinase par-1 [Grifola frondosa]